MVREIEISSQIDCEEIKENKLLWTRYYIACKDCNEKRLTDISGNKYDFNDHYYKEYENHNGHKLVLIEETVHAQEVLLNKGLK